MPTDSRILQQGDHLTVLWDEAGKEPVLLNCEWDPTAINYAEDARCYSEMMVGTSSSGSESTSSISLPGGWLDAYRASKQFPQDCYKWQKSHPDTQKTVLDETPGNPTFRCPSGDLTDIPNHCSFFMNKKDLDGTIQTIQCDFQPDSNDFIP